MAVIGVVSGTAVAWLMGALTWGVDFSRSEHPPYPSLETVKAMEHRLVQSTQQIQRQLNTTNFGLLQLSRATAQAQLDQADAALRKDPENQIARSQHNAAIIQIQIIDQQMKSAAQSH